MRGRTVALVGAAISVVILLSGCHRLGLANPTSSQTTVKTSAATSATPPPTAAVTTPSAVSISVQNGGGIKGRGAAMVSRLQRLGFRPGKATNAKSTNYATTLILYTPGHSDQAAQVRTVLGLGTVQSVPASIVSSTDVLVIVGKDF